MDRGRVGDERGSKEMDGCPLTETAVTIEMAVAVITMTVAE
jgi:hypothetical protein